MHLAGLCSHMMISVSQPDKRLFSGLRNLLDFTARCIRPARFVFCSSVASVLNTPEVKNLQKPFWISEAVPLTEKAAKPMGYARSKWVAEQICAKAHSSGYLSGRVAVARIGQLCGDMENGCWNENEGWPMLISTARDVGCLPELQEVSFAHAVCSVLAHEYYTSASLLASRGFSCTSLGRYCYLWDSTIRDFFH